jgi:hypothetical protein
MIYKSALTVVAVGLLGLAGSVTTIDSAYAQAVTPGISCEPYNSQWNVCTRTFFNPETGKWDQEVYFAPRDKRYAEFEQ